MLGLCDNAASGGAEKQGANLGQPRYNVFFSSRKVSVFMRSGFVTIIGRPNAGKSTLLNALVGEKLAIVTHKPQTTRTRVQGIVNLPKVKGGEGRKARNAAQIILIDTPGVHRSETSLDRKMAQEVRQALDGCDLLLVIADVSRKPRAEDEYVFQMLQHTETPAFLLLNKIDLVQKDKLLPMIDEYRQLHNFREIVPISALKKNGLNALLDAIVGALPQNPPYFPQDQLTDQPLRFLAAEIIREQVLLSIGEEVPYATTVIIERFEEMPKLTRISAAILCERDGQKGILIGKGGSMLKKIGTAARLQIEQMLHGKVFLELFVKVRPGWREEREFIDSIDWRRQLEDMARQQMPKEE
jgi:GTP-binding protein Era